ncbi:MAG: hypothetical protein HYU36_00595 [Planctomycetes bacterium]|nr:hypothetical protein [Planctomycetota bacterium]
MKFWMDVMRGLEPLMEDHQRIFEAWNEGGVDGLVLGPMVFGADPLKWGEKISRPPARAAFDPDERVYRRMGVEAPQAPAEKEPEKRRQLERMLEAAKDLGWSIWIFTPGAGMGPGGKGHFLADEKSLAAFTARILDTMQHYPMADGGILDGPEWGYEIAPHHMNARSFIFNDLPESVEPKCRHLGYDYRTLAAAKDRLFQRLHGLDRRCVALHAGGGWLGATHLFGPDRDLLAWIQFRIDALTDFFLGVRKGLDSESSRKIRMGVGPRSACFAPLCGYDFHRLAGFLDILLPKHYFWHRGFDGLYGTVYRYVETLTLWNPGLSDEDALKVVEALFGLKLPGIRTRADFDDGFPPEFYETIVQQETRRALAAVGDPERVIPWVDSGRRPHHGDPFSAGELRRVLKASAEAGLKRFLYHHHGNLTEGEWAVMTELCGRPWRPAQAPSYRPPDQDVL